MVCPLECLSVCLPVGLSACLSGCRLFRSFMLSFEFFMMGPAEPQVQSAAIEDAAPEVV